MDNHNPRVSGFADMAEGGDPVPGSVEIYEDRMGNSLDQAQKFAQVLDATERRLKGAIDRAYWYGFLTGAIAAGSVIWLWNSGVWRLN